MNIKKKTLLEIEDFVLSEALDKKTKYGLKQEIKYCSNCLMSNQRPNMCAEHYHTADKQKDFIKFEDDICDACKLVKKKNQDIDWKKREFELIDLLDKYRSRNGSYDVLVPGSGGKDSFYVAHILKYKYKMNPMTCTFAPNKYTDWGRDNFYSWLDTGFSNYLFTTNPMVHSFITRLALENLLHPFQPWILGQKNFPTKFATKVKIPLIFYGENPAEYGNPNSNYYDDMLMEWHACENAEDIFVSGFHIKDLIKKFKLNNSELEPYVPLTYDNFKDNNLKCVAWSYFENWHPQRNYYYTVENSNFKPSPERTLGTYSKYSSIDDKIDDLHYYTSKIKFGIGRTHYDVAQEIRSGDITKEEGISLIKKFDGEYPSRFLNEILDYLSMKNEKNRFASFFEEPIIDKSYFDDLCDSFRSPNIWKKTNDGWSLRKSVDYI
tara:strand:+ start:106 stop:1413 length:1308 start_codon:yes stop_codon:yes gene_type:complete